MSFAIGFQLGNDYPLRVTVFRSFVIDVSTSLSLVSFLCRIRRPTRRRVTNDRPGARRRFLAAG